MISILLRRLNYAFEAGYGETQCLVSGVVVRKGTKTEKNMYKKCKAPLLLCLLLIAAIASFSAASQDAFAGNQEYSDISGHWAEKAIKRWAAIINRVFAFPKSERNFFTDTAGKWYDSDVNSLAMQGIYIEPKRLAHGERALSREEAVEMLHRAFMVDRYYSGGSETPPPFTDQAEVLVERTR